MRGSSPELNAAKSEFLLTAVASRLAPGLCTAGEAGLAAWGGRTFSEHPGAVGQHLRVLFSEACWSTRPKGGGGGVVTKVPTPARSFLLGEVAFTCRPHCWIKFLFNC